MWTRTYFLDLGERVLSSFAGALLAFLGGDVLDLWAVNWPSALGVAGGAALVSLIKALLATRVGDPQSAALLPVVRGRHEKD